ncbi:MAG: hypothetical protein ABIN48_11585 [Ginsengibacter sp.]
MIFDINKIQAIIDIFRRNQAVFIGSTLGIEYLSDYDKFLLKLNGIDINKIEHINDIERMFYFGIYSAILGGNNSFKKSNKQFDDWFQGELERPLSFQKKQALTFIKNRAFTDISGLGNRIVGKMNNQILSASIVTQNKIRNKVKKASIKAFEENKTPQQLASILRELTGDWARDFSRIADYVMQESYAHGRVEQIMEMYGDDTLVYKQTFPGVCKHCEKNYGSPGMKPIVFDIADLAKNGDNIGRKDQLPVIGPAHPWARSILHPVPDNTEWSDTLKRFVPKRNTKGIKRTSRVKVTITE